MAHDARIDLTFTNFLSSPLLVEEIHSLLYADVSPFPEFMPGGGLPLPGGMRTKVLQPRSITGAGLVMEHKIQSIISACEMHL
eukprot:1156727-Pelagomonas_calceolata.AAC.5